MLKISAAAISLKRPEKYARMDDDIARQATGKAADVDYSQTVVGGRRDLEKPKNTHSEPQHL